MLAVSPVSSTYPATPSDRVIVGRHRGRTRSDRVAIQSASRSISPATLVGEPRHVQRTNVESFLSSAP